MAQRRTKKTNIATPEKPAINGPKDVSKKQIKVIAAIIIVLALLFFEKGLFVAALVNGKPISRFLVINQLEKQSGKSVLDSLVMQTLILNEAEKRKIKIDQKDIDAQLSTIQKNVEKQGSTLDQALASQRMTKNQLTDQIRLQLLLNKMIDQNVTVTDKEVDDYISANKDQLGQQDSETLRSQIKKQLAAQKIDQKTQQFLQDLKNKANITYFVNY